ncbi:hypothetical protein RND71_019235 [Anisodus tanguticus]|uniref:Uncharacterized protein n=1 Tax=Anisodus tanguticus TaxID=243964 RepID=A0AAE1RYL7_9SOLA|nr:hypothetical protein RND71_019235 [Anisodus tanguticus]
MRWVTDIRELNNTLKEFRNDMKSDVFKVLQYSYDRLKDTNIQECFLYCALYPEDYGINRDKLVDRFVIEGMVKENSRQEEYNRGHVILNKLVKVCLLEETKVGYSNSHDEAVKMHDLLREMAFLKELLLRECRHLRSIPPPGKLKNIRVLDISGTDIEEEILPKLSHLQYLNLLLCINARGEHLASLEVLKDFKGLTEFSITKCHEMKKLFPQALLQDLKNLQKFDVRCYEIEEITTEEENEGSSQLGTSSNSRQHFITSTSTDILILPEIKDLKFWALPNFKRICKGKLICVSLQSITLDCFPELRRLPFHTPTIDEHPLPAL